MEGQLSIFDLIETERKFEPIEALALCGTGFVGGMERVLNYFSQNHSALEKASFLKNEYGIGGFGGYTKKPNGIHSMDTFSSKKYDVRFSYCDEDMNVIESGCSWKQLAETITDMVSKGTYKREVKR